jgi:hypothetical protein
LNSGNKGLRKKESIEFIHVYSKELIDTIFVIVIKVATRTKLYMSLKIRRNTKYKTRDDRLKKSFLKL